MSSGLIVVSSPSGMSDTLVARTLSIVLRRIVRSVASPPLKLMLAAVSPVTLFRLQLRVSCQPLEHLLQYCARPPFALERLSVTREASGRIARVRYVLPRDKAANWGGTARSHDTSRIAWAKLMARVWEEFPMQRPGCGGELVQAHDERDAIQASPDELPVIDIHLL